MMSGSDLFARMCLVRVFLNVLQSAAIADKTFFLLRGSTLNVVWFTKRAKSIILSPLYTVNRRQNNSKWRNSANIANHDTCRPVDHICGIYGTTETMG